MKNKVLIGILLCIVVNKSIYAQVKDVEGNEYPTLNIFGNIWMTENLKTSKFNNGDDILVVFSPKMLLRYPDATSTLEEMATGGFQEVIDDAAANVKEIDTVVLCSGKFYYEMKVKAKELGVTNMAFVRVEQLYPLPQKQIDAILAKYKSKSIIWAQEEPANMGAWTYMAMSLRKLDLIGITRPASAASAEGSKKLHEKRLAKLYSQLFAYAKATV